MNLTPCHTGPAAAVCAFDVALAEVDVDTGELEAVTAPWLRDALLESVLHACTCIGCGAPYGQPHLPGCPQTSSRTGSAAVGSRDLGGIVVLAGGA